MAVGCLAIVYMVIVFIWPAVIWFNGYNTIQVLLYHVLFKNILFFLVSITLQSTVLHIAIANKIYILFLFPALFSAFNERKHKRYVKA